jgi:hypothetical protein
LQRNPMPRNEPLTRLALGAAAGLAGTVVIQGLMAVAQKVAPQANPPMRKDPGEFMLHRAESLLPGKAIQSIPETAEKVAAKSCPSLRRASPSRLRDSF